MLLRVLEAEAMDSWDEAVDYDAMDHSEVNRRFVEDLLATGGLKSPVLDLGTGTALIPIELCKASSVKVVACDVSEPMLCVAKRNVERAQLTEHIKLHRADAKKLPYADGSFPTVISNSIVHHIAEPIWVLEEAWRVLASGGLIFFRDLCRPPDEYTLRALVDTYAADANDHQRKMFADSLRAALTVDEMRQLVSQLPDLEGEVAMTSDRHWTWIARKL